MFAEYSGCGMEVDEHLAVTRKGVFWQEMATTYSRDALNTVLKYLGILIYWFETINWVFSKILCYTYY